MKLSLRLSSAITSTFRPCSSTCVLFLRFLDDPSRSNSLFHKRQRSTICDRLRHITELSDTRFEKGDQYQLRQRASIILKNWKGVLREYLGRPGWSMRKQDSDPLDYDYALFYSTAGRDYHTFPPY